MLHREDPAGLLVIGQPAHAWVSGQLARAWGNERFGYLEPYEEVCLAAEQHDIGMADYDLTPERNPETGLPRSFMEMPIGLHLQLWTQGPRRVIKQSRYAFSIGKACTEPDRSKRNRSNSYLRCKSVDQPLRCRTWRRLHSPNRLQRIQRILHAMDIQLDEPSCLQVAADHEFRHQAPTDRGQ